MKQEYVEQKDGAYRIIGTRVSLDSVVYAFLRGATPEGIQRSFSSLTLEQVYGAITFYLAHRAEIDDYLHAGESEFARLRRTSRAAHPEWYARLESAQREPIAA